MLASLASKPDLILELWAETGLIKRKGFAGIDPDQHKASHVPDSYETASEFSVSVHQMLIKYYTKLQQPTLSACRVSLTSRNSTMKSWQP